MNASFDRVSVGLSEAGLYIECGDFLCGEDHTFRSFTATQEDRIEERFFVAALLRMTAKNGMRQQDCGQGRGVNWPSGSRDAARTSKPAPFAEDAKSAAPGKAARRLRLVGRASTKSPARDGFLACGVI